MSDEKKILTINADDEGKRLDVCLVRAYPALSRSQLKKMILAGKVIHHEKTITDPAYRVKQEQTFTLMVPHSEQIDLVPENINLDIHYEDDDLIVIDKPAGLVVHPGAGTPNGTLVNGLLYHCGSSLSGIGGIKRPGIVHRLDKDTSGLIVVAKNDRSHRRLSLQFEQHSVERTYHALAWGSPKPLSGQIEGRIGRHPHKRKKMAVVSENRGKFALTRFRTLKRYGSRVFKAECRLATGRTHQIRVHLAHIGHPLVGDPIYSRTTEARLSGISESDIESIKTCRRQALHAVTLGFVHPRSGLKMCFSSKFPEDLRNLESIFERIKSPS
ncbi:MAG: RluA family pseudouridine synthase [Pseudomonadota bacterium]|nr:RluA family pseudouridine synthase [Pseudomonadota bacterium]